jgi:hypothetical protein
MAGGVERFLGKGIRGISIHGWGVELEAIEDGGGSGFGGAGDFDEVRAVREDLRGGGGPAFEVGAGFEDEGGDGVGVSVEGEADVSAFDADLWCGE